MPITLNNNSNKLNEILNEIKNEFINISNNNQNFNLQDKNNFNNKINQQLTELQQIKNTIYELELKHNNLKKNYEDEINNLKLQIKNKSLQIDSINQSNNTNTIQSNTITITQPNIIKTITTTTNTSDQLESIVSPISPFLQNNAIIPNEFIKTTNDYQILYNPNINLIDNLSIDLHKSLDHTSVVCCVKFSNNGKLLATGCNKTTQIYNVTDGNLIARLSDDTNTNTTTTSKNNTIDNNNNKPFHSSTTTSSDLYIRSLCFSPDTKFLATGAEDHLIRIWDLNNNKILKILSGHKQDIYSLAYFPNGNKLVSGSGDRTVKIWDINSGQCILTLTIEDGVTTVSVSPDGKYIAAGSLDKTIRVWDAETGFLIERLDSNELGSGHIDSVYSIVFTKNADNLISGSLDKTIKLWKLRNTSTTSNTNKNSSSSSSSSVCKVTYKGHNDFVLSVDTTENDEYILSGSKDRSVLFWDTKTAVPLLMLQGHKNSVISVVVANNYPLGEEYGVFATGSGDCKARIWKYKKNNKTNI